MGAHYDAKAPISSDCQVISSFMKHIRHTSCFVLLVLALCGPALAANESEEGTNDSQRAAPASDNTSVSSLVDAPSEQTTYQILLAEVALQRGDLELACQIYARLSLLMRDPKIMERTIEIAGYARHFDLAQDTARLWLDVDPTSQRAQRMLVSILVLDNRLDELPPHLARLLESNKSTLADNLLGLNRMFAHSTDRVAVFRLVDNVCQPFFGIAEAHYAVALAAHSAGAGERALQEARKALELRPDWEIAALLQAQLLLRTSPDEAFGFMQEFLKHNPDSGELKLLLARALAGQRRYDEAKQYFDELLTDDPDNPEIVYSVAILSLQKNDKPQAQALLERLVQLDARDKSPAYYYLGQIAEDDRRYEEALSHYEHVLAGEHYLSAQMRRARILGQQGKIEQARALLQNVKTSKPEERIRLVIVEAVLLRETGRIQEALDLLETQLKGQPDQPELLYESALIAERLGQMELAETRLRRLIELQPQSPQAYNALGYSYADRNIRLPEARELIEKALALAPEDGFILDSMGWILFRQGDFQGALTYLERSYAQRQDPEIAAHLGEVLWTLDRKDEARRILLEAQKSHPSSEILSKAIRKFAP